MKKNIGWGLISKFIILAGLYLFINRAKKPQINHKQAITEYIAHTHFSRSI